MNDVNKVIFVYDKRSGNGNHLVAIATSSEQAQGLASKYVNDKFPYAEHSNLWDYEEVDKARNDYINNNIQLIEKDTNKIYKERTY